MSKVNVSNAAAIGNGSLIAEFSERNEVIGNYAERTVLSASYNEGQYVGPITVIIHPHKECDYVIEVRKSGVVLKEARK